MLLLLSCFSSVWLCNPTDGSPPGSSVPGILQARILEWVAISFSNACMHAVASVMFDSVWPRGQQPTRFPCPQDSPGKNTGVGCHFLLQLLPYLLFLIWDTTHKGFPGGPSGKESACQCRRHKRSLEEGIATHPTILAWKILGTEEPGGL